MRFKAISKIFLLLLLLSIKHGFSQCATNNSYALTYQSTDGAGNCTFKFQPVVTIQQSGNSVKLIRYTFTSGSSTVTVCYSGNPIGIADCNGSFTSLLDGINITLPAVTIVLPCINTNIVFTASQSGQGTNACTTQTVSNGPLPVKLLSFTGTSILTGIQLNWTTEWEAQNEGFSIQKSKNAKSFETIGYVSGQRTTDQASTYKFQDKDVIADQLYYYRLYQKDISGAGEYSKIIAVHYRPGQEPETKVFPNATTTGSFTLSMPNAASAIIKLYDPAGIEVPIDVRRTDNPNIVSVSSSHSSLKGVYVLQTLPSGSRDHKRIKVIFQ